jgi:hypothetical protein
MVPVVDVVHRTFATFVMQAREKDILFELQGGVYFSDAHWQLPGGPKTVYCVGDAARITQVLFNSPFLSCALLALVLTLFSYSPLCRT